MWNMAKEREWDEDRSLKFVRIKTHVLKVFIHCQGCMHKVKKLLRKVEGVYVVKIEAGEHRVTVSGTVDCARLIDKLTKSGKHAKIWTSSKQIKNEAYLGNKQHSRSFSEHYPHEENISSWEFEHHLKNNHRAGAGTGENLSMEYNTRDTSYYTPQQYGGFNNTYAATPVYEYQYPLPAAVDYMHGSWHNSYYPYSMENTNMHSMSNNMMHAYY